MKRVKRKDHEPPHVTAKLGWRYHHLGIPTKTPRPGEAHIPHLKIHVSGFETSPFGIEWMRFDDGGGFPEVICAVPHVAFEVDDLELALRECGCQVLSAPNSPSAGVRVAMILHDGAPIELIEFKGKKRGGKRAR
jgi:catechol 2,3-dioxygenase-like lactoylglutathione lyase family enzyme